MRKPLLLTLFLLPFLGIAQLSLTSTGSTFLITFDETVTNVTNGAYTGAGFSTTPFNGGLNSNAWEFSGFGTADITFGGTANGAVGAGGPSTGGVTNKGFYGFDINGTAPGVDRALGWQSSATNGFNPGNLTLRIQNNTGATITNFRLGYLFAAYNDQNGTVDLDVSYSFDNSSFSSIPGLSAQSSDVATSTWQSSNQDALVQGVSWADGTYLYVRYESSSAATNYDEVAIDDFFIIGYDVDYVWNGTAWSPSEPSGNLSGSKALVLAGGVAPLANSTTLDGISINPGGKLDIQTDLTIVTFGRIEADANGYGQITGELIGTNTYFELYLEDVGGLWRNVAIPMGGIGGLTVADISGIPVNADGNANTTNIWRLDPTTDADADDMGDFVPLNGPGSNVSTVGLQIFAGDTTYWGEAPFTLSAVGAVFNDGNITLTVSDGPVSKGPSFEAYNLLPNPYPSALDWDVVYANITDFASTYYIQDGTPDIAGNTVQYYSYDASGGGGVGGANQYIAPGQSYFVEYLGTGTGVTFTNAMRTMNATPQHYKTAAPFDQLSLVAKDISREYEDKAFIKFDAQFKDERDPRFEGKKMMNIGVHNLYTHSKGEDYVYNALNDQFSTKEVDLYFSGDYDGFYEIALDQDAIPADWTLELEDTENGNMIDLRRSTYTYYHAAGNDADRFVLHINKNNVSLVEEDYSELYSYLEGNMLTLQLADQEGITVKVFAVNGQLVSELEDAAQVATINTSNWSEGVYIVKAYLGDREIHSNKIIK